MDDLRLGRWQANRYPCPVHLVLRPPLSIRAVDTAATEIPQAHVKNRKVNEKHSTHRTQKGSNERLFQHGHTVCSFCFCFWILFQNASSHSVSDFLFFIFFFSFSFFLYPPINWRQRSKPNKTADVFRKRGGREREREIGGERAWEIEEGRESNQLLRHYI